MSNRLLEITPIPRKPAAPQLFHPLGNDTIAKMLRDYSDLLEQQGEEGFQRAYRRAANVIDAIVEPVCLIAARDGLQGLIDLPAIGRGIAGAISEICSTGRWSQLERLKGDLTPEALFRTLPGVGAKLAKRLAHHTHAETLEDLEQELRFGARDIPGIGPRRKRLLMAALSDRLGRISLARGMPVPVAAPTVAVLLEVDRMYREKAAAGQLKMIAPRRFNPRGEAWLPILHARHDDWHFTALYSNTARAHDLGKTGDWVVIFYQQDGQLEGRATVVTETRGPHAGERVVRGREEEPSI